MRLAYTDSAMNTFLSLDRTVQKELKNTWMRFRLWMTRGPEVMLLRESCPVYGDIVWVIGESSVK